MATLMPNDPLVVASDIPAGKTFDALLGAGAFARCAGPFALAEDER